MAISIKSSTDIYRIQTPVSGEKVKKTYILGAGDSHEAGYKGRVSIDGDTLELSDEVTKAIREAHEKMMEQNAAINELNAAAHNMVVAEQQGDAIKEEMEGRSKALEIAGRIAKGGQVPPKDEAYLLEKDPDLYKLVQLQSMMAKEHKKHKTVLEEDKEPKEYDYEAGQDGTVHRVAVDVEIGSDGAEITGVSEVAVDHNDLPGNGTVSIS